ncbi:MAG: DUF4301 family protein [Flavobacteriales bacterium]|nr:DUF4301 family protein [Flavobacteriales bacterium]
MTTNQEQQIIDQREKVSQANPKLNIVAPCRIGNGILQLTESEWDYYYNSFKNLNCKIGVFIPASGSGSRMFEFLFDFLSNPTEENRSLVERFLNRIQKFAFFRHLPLELQRKLINFEVSLDDFANYLLQREGMAYGEMPKGLIPFHVLEPFVLNPIQEHIVQSNLLRVNELHFHFTIQKRFEDFFKKTINQIEGLTGTNFQVSYSEQNQETDSYVFDLEGNLVVNEENQPLRRPAGHGALLHNLQSVEGELIFIKNIDNVQHYSKSQPSIKVWSALGSLLFEFKQVLKSIEAKLNLDKLKELNKKYDVFSASEIEEIKTNEQLIELINRPIRICGMVRNEGQPGGGPFHVEENGIVRKQIVEKAQISNNPDQYKQMVQSTHFNPVMMVLSTTNLKGEKLDLTQFCDDSKYFVVSKKQKGKEVRFIELPGLWNGSMANWTTLFVEVPNETFSPVKTVLDLLNEAHLA